jgi:Astacin (Peptidase family M12A)
MHAHTFKGDSMQNASRNIGLFFVLSALMACQGQPSQISGNPVQPKPKTHTLGMDGQATPVQIQRLNEQTGQLETITAGLENGRIVYQGEVLQDAPKPGKITTQAAIVTTRKWPNNTVYYAINATRNTRQEVLQAVAYYNAKTNLRWVARSTQTDYVEFVNTNEGCWSYVGRQSGKQTLSLDTDGCGYETTLHEMGHALGLHHEQSRPDRDQYVKIRFDLIPKNLQYNWQLETESRGWGNYDYYSIMHYPLEHDGKKVIEVLKPGIDQNKIGNATSLSATDISAVNSLYPLATTPAPSTQNYAGTFSSAETSNYHSSATGFRLEGGPIKATLSGPKNADFDLILQKLVSGNWRDTVRSDGETSSETITSNAGAGTYRWEVYAYAGTGKYTLVTQK